VGIDMQNERSFSAKELHRREQQYTTSGTSLPATKKPEVPKPETKK
jgi:hypothetical protein